MEDILSIIPYLKNLSDNSNEVEDVWSSISIYGDFNKEVYLQIVELFNVLPSSLESIVECEIDTDKVSKSDLILYKDKSGFKAFKLKVNKIAYLEKNKNESCNVNFFLTSENCLIWFKAIEVLNEKCPIHIYEPLCVIVEDLEEIIGNERFHFCPVDDVNKPNIIHSSLPTSSQIKENVHFITDSNIIINPNCFKISTNVEGNLILDAFIHFSCIVLSCSIINEFYNKGKVIIDGIRRIPATLYTAKETSNYELYLTLTDIVTWIYEDKLVIRRKLFNDRLTLDFNEQESVLSNLEHYGISALIQAKERYVFVITERKDAYIKELKELLKDLRGQSDLYSLKIRTLLNNFLRDLLASLILIGFTVFTKFSDNLNLDKSKLLEYVFISLGAYYLISIIFQVVVDWIDINITSSELRYWKNASNDLLPEREFEKHYKSSLQSRKRSIYWIYPIISLMYVIIAVSCFNYPKILKNLIVKIDKANHAASKQIKDIPKKDPTSR